MIVVAVEGDTDVPFVTALCNAAGFEVRAPLIGRTGKPGLDEMLPGLARAGHGSPHLVVRDLDHDAECPGAWIASNLPADAGRYFRLRLAVRAVEAWFLSDRKRAAEALSIPVGRIPLSPDNEADPKLTVVALARLSKKADIQRALVPRAGATRKVGRGYAGWLLQAAEGWSLEAAMKNSRSLARAYERLVELERIWSEST